jgi:membrane-associated phospholipid phosphatase
VPVRPGFPTVRVLASLAAISASYVAVRTDRAHRFDDAVASVLRRPLGPTVDTLVGVGTDLGSVYGLTGIAAALALAGRREAAFDVFGAGATAWVVAQGAKPTLDRPRPYQEAEAERLVAPPAGSSWPSGHSAVASAIGTTVSDHGRRGATATGVGLVGFVAASRIYVGVHHATDPVAGWGIGVISATMWQTVRSGLRAWRRRVQRRRRAGRG